MNEERWGNEVHPVLRVKLAFLGHQDLREFPETPVTEADQGCRVFRGLREEVSRRKK